MLVQYHHLVNPGTLSTHNNLSIHVNNNIRVLSKSPHF